MPPNFTARRRPVTMKLNVCIFMPAAGGRKILSMVRNITPASRQFLNSKKTGHHYSSRLASSKNQNVLYLLLNLWAVWDSNPAGRRFQMPAYHFHPFKVGPSSFAKASHSVVRIKTLQLYPLPNIYLTAYALTCCAMPIFCTS